MAPIVCGCGRSYPGEGYPVCPQCLSRFVQENHCLKKKHDPEELPLKLPGFRSVLSHEMLADPGKTFTYAAESGTWYWSKRDNDYFHTTHRPLSEIPGSGVPAGKDMPTFGMDHLLIAQPLTKPHSYAQDPARIGNDPDYTRYTQVCEISGCTSLAYPGRKRCIVHAPDRPPASGILPRV